MARGALVTATTLATAMLNFAESKNGKEAATEWGGR